MTETIRYGLIGKQDLRLGTGKFEVTLADGRTVILDEVNLSGIVSTGMVLVAPDGSTWELKITNDGLLQTVKKS